VAAQGNLFLRAGTTLLSNEGRAMMTITASAVDYHDTIGGACSCRSNTLRYGHHTKWQHACVENFLEANLLEGRGKRDIVSNINFFMNVPVEADGSLGIVDGISAPGLSLDLRAEMDVVVVVSNCPQINNPCNAFNPTPCA
jgi:urea carboxylase-associated protein 1